MSISVMKQAAEALEVFSEHGGNRYTRAADALRQAIAEAEKQEPNGYLWFTHHMEQRFTHYKPRQEQMIGEAKPVYTTPQPAQREWVGLTDEDLQKLAAEQHDWEGLCYAVEAKLKEKNN